MQVAYAEPWLRGVVCSAPQLQLVCGPAWQQAANLLTIVGEVANLHVLGAMPAIEVAVLLTGALTYVLINYGEVELEVVPYDDRARRIQPRDRAALVRVTCLELTTVSVRGTVLARPASAFA